MKTKTEHESSDQSLMVKIVAGVAALSVAALVLFLVFTKDPANQPYEGEFKISDEDKTAMTAVAEDFLEKSANYGVRSLETSEYPVNKENFMDLLEEMNTTYNSVSPENSAITRKAVYEQILGYLTPNSRIKENYKHLYSDEYLTFLPSYRASNIEVIVPEEGFYDEEDSASVILTVSFTSTKTIAFAKDSDVTWDGIVEVKEKIDEEEIQLVLKKNSGVWGVFNVFNVKNVSSIGVMKFEGVIDPEQYELVESFDTGERKEVDTHSHENTDPNYEPEAPGSFDHLEEKDGKIILPDPINPDQS